MNDAEPMTHHLIKPSVVGTPCNFPKTNGSPYFFKTMDVVFQGTRSQLATILWAHEWRLNDIKRSMTYAPWTRMDFGLAACWLKSQRIPIFSEENAILVRGDHIRNY